MFERSSRDQGWRDQTRSPLDKCNSNCGSGLAREFGGSGSTSGTEPALSRASPLPHWLWGACEIEWRSMMAGRTAGHWINATQTVGAGLPANAVGQAAHVALNQRFRGQARSHIGLVVFERRDQGWRDQTRSPLDKCNSNCGSGLARECVGSGNKSGTEPLLSRASPLPHLPCVALEIRKGQ